MKDIKQTAINLLSYRDHSRLELRQKLIKKGFSSVDIEPLLNELCQKRLINEHNFAENYCYFRRQKGYGPVRVTQELQNRGISSDIIAEVIDITDNEWLKQARSTWLKHFKGKPAQNIKEQAKQIRYLQYRGFTREQTEYAMSKHRLID